jgi:hypothetical protein
MAKRKSAKAGYGDHDARHPAPGARLQSSYVDYRHPDKGEHGFELGETEKPQAYREGHEPEHHLDLGSEDFSERSDEGDFPSKLLEEPEPRHARGESDWSGGPSISGDSDGPSLSQNSRLLEDPEPGHARGESDWSGGPSISGESDGPNLSGNDRK